LGDAPQSVREPSSPYLVDHVLELSLGRVLAERAHDSAQLLRGDGTVTILVEQGEDLLDLGNLLLCSDTPPFSINPHQKMKPPAGCPPSLFQIRRASAHHLATAIHTAPRWGGQATPCHTSQLVREFLELRDLLGVRRGICLHLLGHYEHSFRVLFDLDKMTIDANTIPVIMSGVMRVHVKCMCARRVAAYRMRICLTCFPLSQVAPV
jgi:hypothetical protein